jgi:hypothetical protein
MSEVQFAKKHIRNRFSLMVMSHVADGLLSVYENSKSVCEKNNQIDQTLKTFQNLLTFIPKWDEARLIAEVDRIQIASNCNYLEELLTATLITYLRAFAAVQYANTPEIEVEFERPPLPRFIHELYKECARQCWTHAYLFKTYGTSMEQQARNRREIDSILDTCLDTALDSFLPWKSIVEKYFKEPEIKKSEIVPTNMMEEEEEEEEEQQKKNVKFESEGETEDEDEDEDEDEGPKPTLTLSDETVDIDLGIVDEDEKTETESVGSLVPSDELVLNL